MKGAYDGFESKNVRPVAQRSTQEDLQTHIATEHSQYECEECQQMFNSQTELDTHVQEMHPEQEQIPRSYP